MDHAHSVSYCQYQVIEKSFHPLTVSQGISLTPGVLKHVLIFSHLFGRVSYIAPFTKSGAVPWPVNRNSLVFSPTVITAHQIGCLVTFDNTHLVINIYQVYVKLHIYVNKYVVLHIYVNN